MKLDDYKFNPLIWIIISGVFLLRIGTTMSIPFLSIFLHFKVGLELSTTGLIVGVSYLASAIGGFFGGALSDKYGRRFIFAGALLCYALTFVGFGLAACIFESPIIIGTTFGLLNLFSGLCRVWSDTLGQAMLSDIVNPQEKIIVFNLRYTSANVGAAIGPILGALFGISGTMNGFYFAGIIYLVYFVLFMISSKHLQINNTANKNDAVTIVGAATTLYSDKSLCYYIIGGICACIAYTQVEATIGQILVRSFGNANLFNIILTVNAITVICFQIPLTNYCLKKHSPLALMQLGCVFLAGGLFGMAFAELNYVLWIVSQIIFTLGEIFILSIGGVFIDSIAPVELRGAYFGSLGFMQIGKTVGIAMGGILLQILDGKLTLCIFAVIALCTIWFYDKSDKYASQEREMIVIEENRA